MEKKKSFSLAGIGKAMTESPIKWWDWVLVSVIALFCFLSYEMSDLFHTAGCSYGYLDGHFLDFYDYLGTHGISADGSVGLHASYLPIIYMIYAVWNIPMRLLGIVPFATAQLGFGAIMWAKLLPCLVYVASGLVFYNICKELGMGGKKSKIAMYAFLTMPVALYSQFILGQYESFAMLCVLLGFYYWLKKRNFWFVFWFAIGVTFKYTVLVFFLPLLLLGEKSFWKILGKTVGTLIPTAFLFLLYHGSPMFNAYVFGIGSSGDTPTGYLFNAAYYTGYELAPNQYVVYLTVLAFAAVCAYSYFKEPLKGKDFGKFGTYVCCLAAAAIFCFSKWHTQWLMLVIPFWIMTAFLHKNTKIFMILDLLFMVIMVMMNTMLYPLGLDEIMVSEGIFKFLFHGNTITYTTNMVDIIGKLDASLCLSLLTALIGVFALFKHPKFMTEDPAAPINTGMGWIRARYVLGLLFFIVPSMMCLKDALNPPAMMYYENIYEEITQLTPEEELTQSFVAEGTKISKIKFPLSLTDQANDGTLHIHITDKSGQVLFEDTVNLSNKYDGQRAVLTPGISVTPGEEYTLTFTLDPGKTPDMYVGFVFSSYVTEYEDAELDGKDLDAHMAMSIYQ